MQNETSKGNEKIELTLPVNSAYVSAARLTASSISNRMGFDIDDIEDIKAAVSEACIFIMKKTHAAGGKSFHLEFNIVNQSLEVELCSSIENADTSHNDDELGIKMIQALMNTLEIIADESELKISMKKNR